MKRLLQNFLKLRDCEPEEQKSGSIFRRIGTMARGLFALALVAGLAATLGADVAAARAPIACGSVYTVARGDTLFKIAERAYADGWKYKEIHKANQNVLPSSATIEIGDQLQIPCLDGTQPAAAQAAASDPAPVQAAEPTPVTDGETTANTSCGIIYTVARGDTLFKIAEQAYPDGWKYKEIHKANRDVLPSSSTIEIGDKLRIPCLDGAQPALAQPAATEPESVQASEPIPVADAEPTPVADAELTPVADAESTPAAGAEIASNESCGVIYTVARGDTLFKIAERAYADGRKYKEIYKANRDVLPRSATIEIGDNLRIPCLDGAQPALAQPATAEPESVQAAEPTPVADAEPTAVADTEPTPVVGAETASNASCAAAYTVAPGDTLFKIAERAYANGWKYKLIFKANRDLLPNEASVEIGHVVLIPCLDGNGPATRRDAIALGLIVEPETPGATEPTEPTESMAAAETPPAEVTGAATGEPVKASQSKRVAASTEAGDESGSFLATAARIVAMVAVPGKGLAAPEFPELSGTGEARVSRAAPIAAPIDVAPEMAAAPIDPILERPLRLLTGNGLAYYSDEALPNGGLITDLVVRTVEAAAPTRPHRVTFVDNLAGHLSGLLPDGEFDVGFPWFKPDCTRPERLSEQTRRYCTDFEFSQPLFELRVGFYARTENPIIRATSLAALSGKRICRPYGHFTFDLEQAGLVEPNVSLETRLTADQCFARLASGGVDIVTMVKREGDALIERLGTGAAAEIIGMRSTHALHAVVSKQNQSARQDLVLINQGLESIMASGKWFEIVTSHQGRQSTLMN